MLIKLILVKKNLAYRIFPNTCTRLGNAALYTSRSHMYVKKGDFTDEKLRVTIFP